MIFKHGIKVVKFNSIMFSLLLQRYLRRRLYETVIKKCTSETGNVDCLGVHVGPGGLHGTVPSLRAGE